MAKLEGYQRIVWPDYHLESEIGHGGYSKVFKAVNLETSQTVAIKISDTINFQSEAQILKNLSQLNHPHIVEFINYKNQDSNQSHNYLVLAYLEGQSLTAYLKNFQNIDFQKIEPIFLQICDAVESLHDLSIFHLDLKPSNIFLIPDDFGGFIAKLIDFGSACDKLNQIDSPNIDSERPIGTPGFISTEQLLEKKSQLNNQNNNITIDHRADIYGLGSLLGFMLEGSCIFEGANPHDIMKAQLLDIKKFKNRNISQKLKNIIAKATDFDPSKRFQSVTELSDELISV